MNELWIKQIQQKMADYQEPAPEVLWDEVEKAVLRKQSSPTRRLWLRSAAAVLLLIATVVGYKALEKDAPIPEKQIRAKLSQRHQQMLPPEEEKPVTMVRLAKANQPVRTIFESDSVIIIEKEVEVEAETETIAETTVEEETVVEPATVQPKPERVQQKVVYPSDLHKSSASKNRLTAKLYLSNGMGSSNHSTTGKMKITESGDNIIAPIDNAGKIGEMTSGNSGENGEKTPIDKPGETFQIIPAETKNDIITTTQLTHHYQPIRYGLSMRYCLNSRWAVETGIIYSLLTSDIEYTTNGYTISIEMKQRLNYIGIPLKAEYLLWESRHFNVYVSGGTTIEKMVKGSQENTRTGTKENVSIRSLQLSVNSGIGAEYKFSNLFSIYAEPGLSYFFDNGSSISTFYQDKPLNFNLNVGLRLQINNW